MPEMVTDAIFNLLNLLAWKLSVKPSLIGLR